MHLPYSSMHKSHLRCLGFIRKYWTGIYVMAYQNLCIWHTMNAILRHRLCEYDQKTKIFMGECGRDNNGLGVFSQTLSQAESDAKWFIYDKLLAGFKNMIYWYGYRRMLLNKDLCCKIRRIAAGALICRWIIMGIKYATTGKLQTMLNEIILNEFKTQYLMAHINILLWIFISLCGRGVY